MPSRLRRTLFALAIAPFAAALPAPAPVFARSHHRLAEQAPLEAGEPSPPAEAGSPPAEPPAPRLRERGGRRGRCSVSVEAPAPVVGAGETVTLHGQLTCPQPADAAAQQLVVYQRERGAHAGMRELATLATDQEGSYQLTTPPLTGRSVFVVRSAVSRPARTIVGVSAAAVALDGPAADGAQLATHAGARHAGRRNRFTFSGSVSPTAEGARVALQRQYLATGERWRTIGFTRVDAEGRFSITRGFRRPGEVSVRAVVHVKGELPATSEPLTYEIVQAQNPELTIQASPAAVVSGQSTTISGVAAGPAGQPLALLARIRGHAFAVVAIGASEADGAYSFTVSPQQDTAYRVRSAATSSSRLFVDVRPASSG